VEIENYRGNIDMQFTYKKATAEDIDILVTDGKLPEGIQDVFQEANVTIL
jgi:hypothetical protein